MSSKGNSVSSQGEHPIPEPGAPAWDHPTGSALWRLSMVLRETSESLEPRREKEEALGQASTPIH
jgi:hypothetical protein